MTEIVLYQNKELTSKVGTNLMVSDIKDSKMSKEQKMVVIASRCFPRINQRKNEVFPDGEKVGDIDVSGQEVRQFEIKQHINKAIFDSGFGASLDKEDKVLLISSILTDVMTKFAHLTTQEVGIAFKKGCREEYGDYMGVSTRIFFKWLTAYCNETRHNTLKEFKKLDVPKVLPPTKEELEIKNKIWLDDIYASYDEFMKTGEFKYYDINNMFYDYLKDLGIITIDSKVKKEILVRAKKIVKIQNDPLQEPNKFKRIGLLEVIDKLNKKDSSMDSKILSQAKHIHLKLYISDLRNNKKCLKTTVTNKTQQN